MLNFASVLNNLSTGLSCVLLFIVLHSACAGKSVDIINRNDFPGIFSVSPGSELLPIADIFTITVVGTVDGNIHAIDHDYNLLWTSSTGGPLARGAAIKSSSQDENAEYVIPTLDGTLLLHNTANGMRKTSISARLLAEKTPFISGEGLALTGAKEDKIFGLDLSNGNSLLDRQEAIVKLPTKTAFSPSKSLTKKRSIPILFGREDFIFRGIDALTGSEKFSFSYAEIFPLSEKNKMSISTQDSFQADKSTEENVDGLQGGEAGFQEQILSTPEGFVYFLDKFGDILNNDLPVALQSPAVAAFKVLIKDGEAIQTKRLSVKHSLQQLRNYLRLRQPKALPSSLVSSTALKQHKNVEEEPIPFQNPASSLPHSNMVIVQGEINEGTQESTNLYAMEIIVPSEVPSNLPVISSENISPAINHESDKSSRFDKNNEIHENIENNNAFLLECDAIFEAEKSEKLGKPSSGISKTRLNLNMRHSRKSFPSSTYNGNQQLTQEELRSKCHNLKKHHFHNPDDSTSTENEKEWRSLDEYLLEYDEKSKDISPSSIPIKINRIRGLHKLTINEPHEEFWLPKIQKDLQRHMDEQRKIFSPSSSSNNNRDTMKANKLNPSVLSSHFNSFISILSSFVTFLFIFSLLVFLLIMGYIFQLPPNAKISEQTDIARFFIPYISFHFPVIRSFLVHYFIDLDHLLTKSGDHDDNGKSYETNATTIMSTSRHNHPNILSETLDDKGRKVLKVGSLRVYEAVLGIGSHGTVVFVGTLHARPIAVKRMLKMLHLTAEREMSLLIKSDGHPNVVRYFIKEECNDFIYLGLQLCVMSVKDFVLRLRQHVLKSASILSKANSLEELLDDPYGCFINFDNNIPLQSDKDSQTSEIAPINSTTAKCGVSDEVRRSLLQIAQGLSFLHSQKILHRDLKPHNILLSPPNEHAVNKDDALSGHFRSQYFVDGDNPSPIDNTNNPENSSSTNEKRKTNAKIVHLNQLGEFVLKISDMGLSKQLLDHTDASFSRSAASLSLLSISSKKRMISSHERSQQDKNGIVKNRGDSINVVDTEAGHDASLFQDEVGTIGWQAPEIVRHHRHKHTHVDTRGTDKSEIDQKYISSSSHIEANICEGDKNNTDSISKNNSENQLKADIFSLGCVFYYVLSLGGHPFGAWYEREQNIINNNCNLSLFDENCPEVSDLLGEMLQADAMERPSAMHVAQHPFFWSSTKRLEFLTDFSDSVEKLSPDSPALLSLEAQGHFRLSQQQQTQSKSVFRGSWDRFIDPQLLHDGGKYRRYDARSVKDLLRLIRNKKHHFLELPVSLRETLGNVPHGYLQYFESRFPRLLLHCIRVAMQHLKEDKLLSRWMEHLHLNPQYITPIDQHTPSNNVSQKSSGKEGCITSSQLSALSPSFIPSSLVTENGTDGAESSESSIPAIIVSNSERERIVDISKESIVDQCEDISTLETSTIDVEIEKVNSPQDTDDVIMKNDIINEKDSDQQPTETDAKVVREMSAQWETQGVVVWRGSSLEQTLPSQCRRGWLRDTSDWVTHGLRPGQPSSSSSKRPQRLIKQTTDLKYRSRLCSHWEMSGGTLCPMRKRGKCAFAHSPLELRVKENRRDKWPTTPNHLPSGSGDTNYENCVSGGEDVLTAARHSDPSILALYKPPAFPAAPHSVSVTDSPHRAPSLSPVSPNMHPHFPFPAHYAPASATYRVPAENAHHFSPSRPATFHNYHPPASHMPSYPQYSDPNHLQYNGGFGYSEFGSGDNSDTMYPPPFPPYQNPHMNTEG